MRKSFGMLFLTLSYHEGLDMYWSWRFVTVSILKRKPSSEATWFNLSCETVYKSFTGLCALIDHASGSISRKRLKASASHAHQMLFARPKSGFSISGRLGTTFISLNFIKILLKLPA